MRRFLSKMCNNHQKSFNIKKSIVDLASVSKYFKTRDIFLLSDQIFRSDYRIIFWTGRGGEDWRQQSGDSINADLEGKKGYSYCLLKEPYQKRKEGKVFKSNFCVRQPLRNLFSPLLNSLSQIGLCQTSAMKMFFQKSFKKLKTKCRSLFLQKELYHRYLSRS